MMTIAQYLERHQMPLEIFAYQIGVTQESVRRYMRGARRPTPEVMLRIVKETNGEITANDFYDVRLRG